MPTAKLFWTGRSQAVRLPKDFRFEGSEVRIHRQGNRVVLEPVAENWDWLDAITGAFDENAALAALDRLPSQDRPELDDLFK